MADTTPIYLEEFKALHAADLADRLQRMPVDEARNILGELPVKHASDALTRSEEHTSELQSTARMTLARGVFRCGHGPAIKLHHHTVRR